MTNQTPTRRRMPRRSLLLLAALMTLIVPVQVGSTQASAASCARTYTARSGDGWWRIANRQKITLKQLLTINRATTKTFIQIGDKICLPAAPQPAAPRRVYTRAQVIKIIKAAWPDHLEDTAIAVAQRETGLYPYSQGGCCYGLFQIYWSVHQTWLKDIGITSAAQLLDPVLNAKAGYVAYRRNGWNPWCSTKTGFPVKCA